MAITAAQIIEQIENALAGASSIPPLQVVGEAIDYITSMHTWSFLKRPAATLAAVAGQGYLELPSDFGEVLSLQVSGSYYGNVVMTDPDTFLGLESGALNETGWAYWTILESADGGSDGSPTTRLALWPTPTANDASFAVMRYRAIIPRPASDDTQIKIPSYMESLLFHVARAFAQGYEEAEGASTDQRLAEIMAGSIFYNAKQRDGRGQWRFGQFKGGAGDRGSYGQFWEGTGLPA